MLDTQLQEDNRTTMLLMKNGRLSSGKRTKRLGIRYFCAEDLIGRGIVHVTHCVSDAMIADFFMKPLQGKHFQILRDLILNVNSTVKHRSVLASKDVGQCYVLLQ
jgi:hypothetical protein